MSAHVTYRRIRFAKYRLEEPFVIQLPVKPPHRIEDHVDEIVYDLDGTLHIAAGYTWDGSTGPSFDTPSIMRATIVHDAFYQLMADGFLPLSYRKPSDDLFQAMCKEDGMNSFRAWYSWLAVRLFGGLVLRIYPKRSGVEASP